MHFVAAEETASAWEGVPNPVGFSFNDFECGGGLGPGSDDVGIAGLGSLRWRGRAAFCAVGRPRAGSAVSARVSQPEGRPAQAVRCSTARVLLWRGGASPAHGARASWLFRYPPSCSADVFPPPLQRGCGRSSRSPSPSTPSISPKSLQVFQRLLGDPSRTFPPCRSRLSRLATMRRVGRRIHSTVADSA